MTNIFVYGTLRKGFGNHRLLTGAKFIGNATTKKNYAMFGGGIPFVNKDIEKYPIIGEVYAVTDAELKNLDRLEGHPDWYKREPIDVILENGEPEVAEIYFNNGHTENLFPTGDYKEGRPVR